MPSIYAKLKAAGCKLDNHESDLYVQKTPESQAILVEEVERKNPAALNARAFRSQIDGEIWFDLPFSFDPWWQARAQKPNQKEE